MPENVRANWSFSFKKLRRIVEKCALRPRAEDDVNRVLDVCRAMVVIFSIEDAEVVLKTMARAMPIVRVKNRRAKPSLGGGRDLLVNVRIDLEDTFHICEAATVQV